MKLVMVYFILFIIYAFVGWSIEVIRQLMEKNKFVNRGFLIGPYCPIYGYGALAITILLRKYINEWFVLFVMAILTCGILEYFTSFLMEKIFKARWWDYSNRKFNINGRICLENLALFGLLGLFITYVTNPFLLKYLNLIPNTTLIIISSLLFVVYFVDNIISFNVIATVRETTKGLYKELDNTEEITRKVKEILLSRSLLSRRLIHAYPKLQAIKAKIKEGTDKIKENTGKIKEGIEQKFK